MNATLESFRPKFLGRPRREKLLLVAFLVALAVVWFGSLIGRAQTTVAQTAGIRSRAADQQRWLEQQAEIESTFDSSMATLRDSPLPPLREVTAGIQALLQKHGIEYSLPSPDRIESDGLAINTFSITINRAEWNNLYAFHEELATALPTVNIAEIRLQSTAQRGAEPNPSPPLSARVRLVAVELNR